MAFNLYTSNRLELLVEYLTMVLDQQKLPPLDSEIIIVQSQGMARFLAMELARRNGVWAGGVFPFPNAFLQDVFGQILEEDFAMEPWQRGPLSWRIFNVLPSLLTEPGFEVLCSYCHTPEKTFQLSQQVSDLFDQYVLYRPEMIHQWSNGNHDSAWQPVLWQRLLSDIDQPNRADQFAAVLKQLSGDFTGTLPKRISLFGISSMAPVMIEVFAALARHTEVNVFFVNPCQDEWSAIMTSGSITKVELATGQDKEAQFLENGNELLASMGHLGRDFFDLLLVQNPVVQSISVPAPDVTLLAAMQNDILDLQPPAANMDLDDSVHLVSCHNGMREVEVLLDHLLHLFSDHDDLQPRDILVMAPDIGGYAPLIDAVFRETRSSLPYSIADQSMQEQECFAGYLQLLRVAKGRWRVTEIMSLLEIPAICRQFGLEEDDLAVVKEWLQEVHVHWGRDRGHREQLGLPPSAEHSFAEGINRLLLGFAMDGDELFMGMLPFKGAELDVEVAGKFLAFYERLLAASAFLEGDKPLEEWSLGLLNLVDVFFAPTAEQEWEIGQLRTIIGSLLRDAEQGGFSQEVTLDIIEVWLKKALNLDLSPYGFLSGGITFCSLLPMRAIPFQVVCLLGMNDADFPRTQIRPGFDLTARDYRQGDRNKRNDDRYLFLEALLSARKQLYISFVGRSIVDNRQILPSVLVSELLEYITACLAVDDSGDPDLVVQHPIQPFHVDYFNGTLPLSHSRENYQACTVFLSSANGEGRQQEQHFLEGLDIANQDEDEVIAFTDVLRFWQNPPAFFCSQTLGLSWDDRQSLLEDDEPFSLSGLEQYHVALQCVDLLLEGQQPSLTPSVAQKMRATGFLPHGAVGDMDFGRVAARAEMLAAQLKSKMAAPCDEVETTLVCGDYTLEVYLDNLYQSGQVLARIGGRIDGRHLIKVWLQHLVLQLVDSDAEKTTYLISADEMVTFPPVEEGAETLNSLLRLYRQGLASPLPFFARSSWVYAKITAEKGAGAGLVKAATIFNPEFKQFTSEADDPATYRCFGDYVLGGSFADLAGQVFDPLLDVALLELSK